MTKVFMLGHLRASVLALAAFLVASAAQADSTSSPPALSVAAAAGLQTMDGQYSPCSNCSFNQPIADLTWSYCALTGAHWIETKESFYLTKTASGWVITGSIGGANSWVKYVCIK